MVYKNPELCKNKTFINENQINKIILKEVTKKISKIEVENAISKIKQYYKENNKELQELEKCKKELQSLERRKSILYKKKCESYITLQEFKIEYARAKNDIEKYKQKIENLQTNNKSILNEKELKEIILDFKNGENFTNELIKQFINRIEVYSDLQVEIIFNF